MAGDPVDTPDSRRRPLVVICLGFFIVMLDTTIVTVALVDIQRDLHSGVSASQWVVAGYTLVFGSVLLTAGGIADTVGPRRVFLSGLIAFAVTSAACAAAPNSGALVGLRVVQGAAAAMLVPTSLALINASYSDRARRARAIGVWGGMGGVAAAAGPAVGGVLIAAAGWRAVFLVNVPVCLVAFALVRRTVPEVRSNRGGPSDLVGQVLAIGSLALLSYGLIEGGASDWSGLPVALLALGVALLVLFGWFEFLQPQPMFPVRLFRSASFSSAIGTGLLLNFGFYGQLFVLSLYFQQLRGHSPLVTGLLLVPQTATAIVGSTLGGRVTSRTGPRVPIVIGLMVGAAGFAGLLTVGPHTAYPTMLAPMLAAGLGTAFTMPAATAAAVEAAPAGRAGAASGALNAARQIGSVLGVATLGGFITVGHPFVPGFRLAVGGASVGFLVAAALNVLVAPGFGRRHPDRVSPRSGRTADR